MQLNLSINSFLREKHISSLNLKLDFASKALDKILAVGNKCITEATFCISSS